MPSDEREAIREEVIESLERSAEVYGLSRSAGRVYGVLYFSDEPLSIPQLVDETGYAKSTISTVTRKLTRIGLIKRRSSGEGRGRVEFVPETDFWFVIQEVAQQYIQREISGTQRTLDNAIEQMQDLDEDDANEDLERIQNLQSTYDDLQLVLELILANSKGDLIDSNDD